GSVDRSQLHCCMHGVSTLAHELKLWKAKGKMTSLDLAAASGTASSFLVQQTRSPQFSPSQAAQFCLSLFAVQTPEAIASRSAAMDVVTQMVMAGEGGLMAAMTAIETYAALATSLATASVATEGTPMVQTEGAGLRQEESTSMDISTGEARQGEPSEVQIVLPPQSSKRPFESPLYRR
ncbi:MAG: hypothetical protein ACKPKO_17670, partial [Candidatus Fonsibacter sp.]